MPNLEDMSKLAEPEPCYRPDKQSLLSKYDIPVGHFDFAYVENCNDGKEIEKIYHVLLSGEEGSYPQLLQVTEERLRELKPKSRWLRKSCPVITKDNLDKSELNELSKDLGSWVRNISKHSKELDTRKTNEIKSETGIRTFQPIESPPEAVKEQRISSTDYSAWDKYDPDTEMLKMELKEEDEKKAVMEEQKSKTKPKKRVTFNRFATEAEAVYISDREREKGNEFFKAGDYEEALQYYTNSISSKPCVYNLNNRAATYLKLKKYDLALKDCNKVLTIEKDNIKAFLRKGDALEKLKRYEESLECAEFVIQNDPNNIGAQELAERVRRYCKSNLTNTRMKVIEIE